MRPVFEFSRARIYLLAIIIIVGLLTGSALTGCSLTGGFFNREDPRIAKLIDDLGAPGLHTRLEAAGRLEAIGEPAVKPLIQAFNSPNENVRFWATEVRGRILAAEQFGDEATRIAPAVVAASEPDRSADSASSGTASASTDEIIAQLNSSDPKVRANAEAELRKMDKAAIQPLIDALRRTEEKKDYWNVQVAKKDGQSVGGTTVTVRPQRSSVYSDQQPIPAVEILRRRREGKPLPITTPQKVAPQQNQTADQLVNKLTSDNAAERDAAAKKLSRMGSEAVPSLITVLRDNDAQAQQAAADVLGDIRAAKASSTPVIVVKGPEAAAKLAEKVEEPEEPEPTPVAKEKDTALAITKRRLPMQESEDLVGTKWAGTDSDGDYYEFEFRSDNVFWYRSPSGEYAGGYWRQDGSSVYMSMNNDFAEYEGSRKGSVLEGRAWNKKNATWTWRVTRQ